MTGPEASATALRCRFCGAALDEAVLDLGLSPLSNALVDESRLDRADELYPLRAYVCSKCWLMQVPEVVSREKIFSEYAYFSSYSTSWLEHVRRYADQMTAQLDLGPDDLVVEVASNDGHLLRCFQQRGVRVLGVEPAKNVAAEAVASGIPTLPEFFGTALAGAMRAAGTNADLVVCNNVLAHVPDVNDFVAGLATLLKPAGTITLEFPHLLRMLEGGEFDTIYHEHYSYFSLMTASRIFAAHELTVSDVEELPTHGGSLRLHVQHAATAKPSARVASLLAREHAAGLGSIAVYKAFGVRTRDVRGRILAFVEGLVGTGMRLAGYGAPAKATTILNYCGIGTDIIEYTVDRSPHKQGRFIPGVRVPVFAPEEIFERKPDVVVVFPWNILAEITAQMRGIAKWNGRFATLIPEPQLLTESALT
jgi:SAM-dependent methyltransferase